MSDRCGEFRVTRTNLQGGGLQTQPELRVRLVRADILGRNAFDTARMPWISTSQIIGLSRKATMRGAVRLAVAVAAISMIAATTSAKPSLVTRIRTEFCKFPEDFEGDLRIRRTDELRRLGEAARRALLTVARSQAGGRDCALEYLWRLGDQRAIPILRSIVGNPSDPSRAAAVTLLGFMNDRASLPTFLSLLNSGDQWLVRASVAGLGGVNDEQAREALRRMLARTDSTEVQIAAISAVANQHDAAAIPLLVEVARGAEKIGHRGIDMMAAVALADLDRASSDDAAVDAVAAIVDVSTRSDAARGVARVLEGKINSPRPSDVPHRTELIERLRQWF
jgi:HEAT repeat protein